MIQSYNLQGKVKDRVHYSVTILGTDIRKEIYSYEVDVDEDTAIRLFSQGNEIRLTQKGVYHSGCGGSFCEYMFGIQVPVDDLLRNDVFNRLVLFGASPKKTGISFSNNTERLDTYDEVFGNGHLYCNYYFFVTFHINEVQEIKDRQEILLRFLGRTIKKSPYAADYIDTAMMKLGHELQEKLLTLKATLYLVRVFDPTIYDFCEKIRKRAEDNRNVLLDANLFLKHSALIGMDRLTSERLRLDLAYKDPESRQIVDQYKTTLANAHGSATKMEEVRRLKVLCLRKKIPRELLYEVDNKLPLADMDRYRTEPTYINEARQVFEDHVLHLDPESASPGTMMPKEDMAVILRAKISAEREGSRSFEHLLLNMSHRVDMAQNSIVTQRFHQILGLVDAFDSLSKTLSSLMFIDGAGIDPKQVASVKMSYVNLINLASTDLNTKLIDPMLLDVYATEYGKKKTRTLLEALENNLVGEYSADLTSKRILEICEDEKTYRLLDEYIRENIKFFYLETDSKEEKEAMRRKISSQLMQDNQVQKEIKQEVFNLVIQDLQLESAYLNEILPEALLSDKWDERTEFVLNSSLDMHRIEKIERAYCRRHRLREDYIELMIAKKSSKPNSAIKREVL